ncbi:MAG: M23 family metallopeptidase [Bacteroidia bacterium]
MQKQFIFSIYFFVSFFCSLFAQTSYPKDYFRAPINFPLKLAGNFGEIRTNHFHAGFDIRTDGKEGVPVYAVADGYISRIRISAYGYGKALCITHPNGYVSVYAHLRNFNPVLQNFTKNIQYKLEKFEFDTLLSKNTLSVMKGDLIAFSGNTGGSEAPHLHFEMRDEKTEMPINPYFFGYKVQDAIKPTITKLVVYPMDETTTINNKKLLKKIIPIRVNDKYSVSKTDTLLISGKVGFGIGCYDKENNSGQNAVFSIEMQEGGKRLFYCEFEKFSFENARYVNAYIDYLQKQKNKETIQKCFLSKNNLLGIYKNVVNNGFINFNDDDIHLVTFIVKDYVGNTTEWVVKIKSAVPKKSTMPLQSKSENKLDCLKEFEFSNDEIKILIPAYSLYDDIAFKYTKKPKSINTFSNLQQIFDENTASQKTYSLKIKTIGLPISLQNKACIVLSEKKAKHRYEGGVYSNGWVTTETKNFGQFTIMIDTVAPTIHLAIKKKENATIVDYRSFKEIRIVVKDNLSGIKNYRATIDDKWVLCEYDYKKSMLIYLFDEAILSGIHQFKIEVTDDKKNTNWLTFNFKK